MFEETVRNRRVCVEIRNELNAVAVDSQSKLTYGKRNELVFVMDSHKSNRLYSSEYAHLQTEWFRVKWKQNELRVALFRLLVFKLIILFFVYSHFVLNQFSCSSRCNLNIIFFSRIDEGGYLTFI